MNNCINFLVWLDESGLGYSAINTHSALSSILAPQNGEKFGSISCLFVTCMRGIIKLKPSLPKCSKIWDVKVVLHLFRRTFDVPSLLPLKDLTLKLTTLPCLTTGQRIQTIHKFDTNYIQDMEDRYRMIVHEK